MANASLSWVETVRSYLDKRLLWVFMLGCSSGFPWVLIGSNMSGWLKDAGLTRAAIGYFGSVFAVYAINFLWAPLVDRVKLPVLYRYLGQRRSWILSMQLIMLVSTIAMAIVGPSITYSTSDENSTASITSREHWKYQDATIYWSAPEDQTFSFEDYEYLSLSTHNNSFNNIVLTFKNGTQEVYKEKISLPLADQSITHPIHSLQLTGIDSIQLTFIGTGQTQIKDIYFKHSDEQNNTYLPITKRDLSSPDVKEKKQFLQTDTPASVLLNSSVILTLSFIALGLAVASSTQDIAIDAYRIDTFPKSDSSKLPQASAMTVIGWWTGYSLPGYLAFINADSIGWNGVYYGMAAIVGLLMLFTLLVGEPKTRREALQAEAEQRHSHVIGNPVVAWLTVTVLEPFIDFFRRNGFRVALTLLLFVFLFKIGEAFLGRMSIAFYKDIGFSNEQIGYYSKLIGWGLTMLFTLIGSMVNVKFGIVRGLMIGGIAMAASNLMFAWIAKVGPNETLFLATLVVDNFTSAFSTVAFVSFLTMVTGQAFSATQYALLASLGNLGRTTLASFSGELVDYLDDWSTFFVLTALMVIPSLIMLYSLRHYFTDVLERASKDHR